MKTRPLTLYAAEHIDEFFAVSCEVFLPSPSFCAAENTGRTHGAVAVLVPRRSHLPAA